MIYIYQSLLLSIVLGVDFIIFVSKMGDVLCKISDVECFKAVISILEEEKKKLITVLDALEENRVDKSIFDIRIKDLNARIREIHCQEYWLLRHVSSEVAKTLQLKISPIKGKELIPYDIRWMLGKSTKYILWLPEDRNNFCDTLSKMQEWADESMKNKYIIRLSLADYLQNPDTMLESFWNDVNMKIDGIVTKYQLKRKVKTKEGTIKEVDNDTCPLYIKCCKSWLNDKDYYDYGDRNNNRERNNYYSIIILIDDFEKLLDGTVDANVVYKFLKMHRLLCGFWSCTDDFLPENCKKFLSYDTNNKYIAHQNVIFFQPLRYDDYQHLKCYGLPYIDDGNVDMGTLP